MPTTLAINNIWSGIMSFVLVALAGTAIAADDTSLQSKETGVIQLKMSDGSTYSLALPDNVDGVFLDPRKHPVGDQRYISVFLSNASNPSNPSGYCGAGREIRLKVYRIDGTGLVMRKDVLVSSCLHSIALSSQSTGDEGQDSDFSSVQWTNEGFSIRWEGTPGPVTYTLDGKPGTQNQP
ncbi:hypothetical protein [Pseudomonas sp. TE3610]